MFNQSNLRRRNSNTQETRNKHTKEIRISKMFYNIPRVSDPVFMGGHKLGIGLSNIINLRNVKRKCGLPIIIT